MLLPSCSPRRSRRISVLNAHSISKKVHVNLCRVHAARVSASFVSMEVRGVLAVADPYLSEPVDYVNFPGKSERKKLSQKSNLVCYHFVDAECSSYQAVRIPRHVVDQDLP